MTYQRMTQFEKHFGKKCPLDHDLEAELFLSFLCSSNCYFVYLWCSATISGVMEWEKNASVLSSARIANVLANLIS